MEEVLEHQRQQFVGLVVAVEVVESLVEVEVGAVVELVVAVAVAVVVAVELAVDLAVAAGVGVPELLTMVVAIVQQNRCEKLQKDVFHVPRIPKKNG